MRLLLRLFSSVKTAKWVGDCFVYTNSANRLNYLIGSQTHTVANFDTYVLALVSS